MSAAQDAAKAVADTILAGVPALIHESVKERRKLACWLKYYRAERLRMAPKWRKGWWRLLLRIATAKCAANKAIAAECACVAERFGAG